MRNKQARFFLDALRREARSGGEVLKCLEVFERAIEDDEKTVVLADEPATVWIRGSRAYAEIGIGLVRLDRAAGLKDGQSLIATIREATPE